MISCDSNGGGRRIWGLTACQLHDRFWKASSVYVVRKRHPQQVLEEGPLFLLTDPDVLVLFDPAELVRIESRLQCDVVLLRVQQRDLADYRELVVTDDEDRFLRFERHYERPRSRVVKVGVTRDVKLAQAWQANRQRFKSVWRFLRNTAYRSRFETIWLRGRAYNDQCIVERERLVKDLMQTWDDPQKLIPAARRLGDTVWASSEAQLDEKTLFIGRVWIGAGHDIRRVPSVLGPAVLWDQPSDSMMPVDQAPTAKSAEANGHNGKSRAHLRVLSSPAQCAPPCPQPVSCYELTKRWFDIVFSLIALAITLPLYPLVMLAIWREDGGPFFFVHRRETRGGREFGCFKFRTMLNGAGSLQREMAGANTADGPQFHVPGDPRVTRIGRFLRRYYIDEWPQFINVLRGEMSVIGPRPSPFAENQYCPAWREARLSVRGGITGLWQVSRTRSRGLDFLEWIRFDLEYVQNRSWRMDLYIAWCTLQMILWPRRWRRKISGSSSTVSTPTVSTAGAAVAAAVDPVQL